MYFPNAERANRRINFTIVAFLIGAAIITLYIGFRQYVEHNTPIRTFGNPVEAYESTDDYDTLKGSFITVISNDNNLKPSGQRNIYVGRYDDEGRDVIIYVSIHTNGDSSLPEASVVTVQVVDAYLLEYDDFSTLTIEGKILE